MVPVMISFGQLYDLVSSGYYYIPGNRLPASVKYSLDRTSALAV